ncbi:hypothetical protein NAP1_12383 [Erythrobacter sp. NAP1]|uniref:DUF2059 domain-containing protein n=1 Tax=Erythrobacter sp. NAP1 TaxID=237727 RepID=UPI00006875CE|nr:DUF2059 domain-containing protein [Erythrobacter sp. NAP1]EAQ28394.1 hypothetical protein NAP1_12383 [Erythrobacter sp. NAP1]
MLKGLVFATLASVTALTATPALADAHTDTSNEAVERELSAMGDLFGDMFGTAEPLTADQEARVPMAQSVVLKLFPEGTYAKMMDETMAPMMDSMLGSITGSPAMLLLELTGLPPSELSSVDETRLEAAVDLLDPNAEARNAEIAGMTMSLISDIVVQIEPSYRAGLARAYAVRFTEAELSELDAYFATPVGSKYAAESFLIYADPQVMSAMNQMMPAVMEAMPAMMGDIGDIASRYPKGRTFSDLSPAEQDKLATLLGVSLEDLAASEPASQTAPPPKGK